MNGRAVGSFRIVHYIMGVCFSGVSIKTVRPPPFLRSHLSSLPMGVFLRDYSNYIYVSGGSRGGKGEGLPSRVLSKSAQTYT